MKTFIENEEAEIQVELIPLLDVVFCLLAVFILGTVGLSRPEGINLNLPKAETGTPQFSSKFRVQVGILGELLANNQPVNQTQLKQLVSRYLQTTPQGVVILKADGGATYDQVITVLDVLRSVGGERVALETVKSDPVTPPGQVPGQVPGQNDVLPVPSVDGPNPGTFPAAPNQPSTQPITPLPGQPLAPLPGSQPQPSPAAP
ncbi:biopolymer transporter ExbD [Acaryochloris marina]|uniref:ExbD/TolR family protein n=1 Tax=Acaryochloris marina TaxID=155978 RepID=UPI001BAE8C26|nr:biopolymer transporter ExbD [Acaryochloris marina]QUY44209.1 biopolymer transporter ExbD [Acaryochloris marina S15]